jgi:hypothetical protein
VRYRMTGFKRIGRWAAIGAGVVAGAALFIGNLASIKENVLKLFGSQQETVAEINIRDVSGTEAYFVKDTVHVVVQAVVEKKGSAEVVCEPGLLMKNSEFFSFGFTSGAYRRSAGFLPDFMLTSGSSIDFSNGFRQGVMSFYFAVGREDFSNAAKFRLDCTNYVTSWARVEFSAPIEMPITKLPQ